MVRKIIGIAALLCIGIPHISFGEDLFRSEGAWSYLASKDSFSDEQWYKVMTRGLSIKCEKVGEDSIYIVVKGNNYVGSDESTYPARFRVDDGQIITTRVLDGGNYRAVVFPGSQTVGVLLNEIVQGKILHFRAVTFDGGYSSAYIPLAGAAKAVKWLNNKCQAKMIP